MSKTSVLFVCLGNICRSPAAEAVFQKLVNERNLDKHFKIDSAGTSGLHAGEKADPRMIKAAKKRHIEVTSISRQFVVSDFKLFDHIIVMDDSNLVNVQKLDPKHEYTHKLSKMTDFASPKFLSYKHVPDPYYGGEEGFNEVLDLLEDTCLGLLKELAPNSL